MQYDEKFPEQTAPEKNTDNAFVKVGEDGKPDISQNEDQKPKPEKDDTVTSIEHR